MNITVAGCGKIGSIITESLTQEGHNITAIDSAPAVIEDITNTYDVMGVCGNSTDFEVLSEADTAHADLFIAVTGSDDANMLSCLLARKMGAKHTIARIRNPEYSHKTISFIKQQLDLSLVINPELLAAKELLNLLKFPSAVKVDTFAHRDFEMLELRLRENSGMDGICLSELRTKYHAKFLVCVVQRGDEVYIPDGRFVLQAGDKIGLTAAPAELQKLLREMGVLQKKARSVMILGGSRTAFYLAHLLEAGGSDVTLIEKDSALAQELSDLLPKTVVVQGDGAQQDLLLEEDLLSKDAFVALTGIDEENILMSIFAATHRVPKVIAKVNRDELAALAVNLGLDSIVSPRKSISDVVVRYARALQNSLGSSMETLYQLMDGKAEALEFLVRDEPNLVGIPLKDLKTQSGILLAGIIRDHKAIIPSGDDAILSGDRVIVLATSRRVHDLSDILAK